MARLHSSLHLQRHGPRLLRNVESSFKLCNDSEDSEESERPCRIIKYSKIEFKPLV